MDFRQLETFVEVAKLKSFSKAAQKLFLTQPTVTSHIQNLENQLGVLLINRLGKTITLTDAGYILYKHALNILNTRDMAAFELDLYQGRVQGHLEISSSSIPKQYVLPYILQSFIREYPEVTFSITHNHSKSVVEDILSGHTDFGIVGAKYKSKNLQYIDLVNDQLILVVPNSNEYPWEPYTELDIDCLLSERFILREKGSGTRLLVENTLAQHSLKLDDLNVVAYIEDTDTIKRFIELGLGISFISEKAVQKEIASGILKPYRLKDMTLDRSFYFVYHKNRQLSPLTQAFKEFVIDYINVNKK